MNKGLKIIAAVLVVILFFGAIFALAVGTENLNLWWRKTFEPKHKEIDREVWENTPSRVHGATQQIAKSMVEYNRAEDEIEKKAICASLRNMYSNLNPEVIDDYALQSFFKKCKYGG